MPYDPEANAGIDKRFSRNAPPGKFRVVGVDTFDGDDWVEGDFDTAAAAMTHAAGRTTGKQMLKMHVYDDKGRHVSASGSF